MPVICVSANILVPGFDTHSFHERDHNLRLELFTKAGDYLLERAEQLGIRDRVILMMGSEFSRTPKYNNKNAGKDHWPVGSAMFIGPGIRGNRVVGKTNDSHQAMGFDIAKMKAISYNKDGGFRIRPQNIHRSLLKFTGVFDNNDSKRFGLEGEEDIPFFS